MSLSENRCPLFRDMRQPTPSRCRRRTLRTETRVPLSSKCSKLRANQQRAREATIGSWLSDREQRLVAGAETASAATPIPTQIVSNGEYLPPPQSETQKRVERRIFELADENSKRLGLNRRQFLQTSCGMAAAFLAMNDIFGRDVFQVATAEAREPELARARAQGLSGQFIFDVPDPFRARRLYQRRGLAARQVRQQHWNPELKESTRHLGTATSSRTTSRRSIFDSDTKVALLERRAVRRSELVS